MKTSILKWNPERTSYGLNDFQRDFTKLEYGPFRWPVEEAESIRSGDNFFLVKTGGGNCGIVMKGFFISDSYPAKKGSASKMADIRPTHMFHPDNPKGILTLTELKAGIPDFPWENWASGHRVSESQAATLNRMWERFLCSYDNSDYDGILADRNRKPQAGIDDAVLLASEALYDRTDSSGEPLILRSLRSGLSGATEEDKIRGFLRDVVSDPEWSPGALRERGFSETTVDGLFS